MRDERVSMDSDAVESMQGDLSRVDPVSGRFGIGQ